MIEKPKITNHESIEGTTSNANRDIIHEPNKESEHTKAVDHKKAIEHARAKVEQHSKSRETYKDRQESHQTTNREHHHYITKEIKLGAFEQVMTSTRAKLSKKETIASKAIHSKVIESASEIGTKTIARPNLMLGSGILMVTIGSFMLFFAKRYGFELPLSTFIAIYVVGYLSLLFIEIVFRFVVRKKSRSTT